VNHAGRPLNYGLLTLARSLFVALAVDAIFLTLVFAFSLRVGDGGPASRQATEPLSPALPSTLSPTELGLYRHARTLMDWTPKEIKDCPLLGKLRSAENGDDLPSIMKHVGERAAATISDFRNVACDERVYSEWNVGSPIATWREMGPNEVAHHFLYLILSHQSGDPRMFTEYRTDPKGKPVDLANLSDLPLITANFAGSWAYFNSSNQSESDFRYFGKESIQKHMCYVVGFAQKPDRARNITTFEFGKQSAVTLVQGIAWIDDTAFQIVKIETWLLAPRHDIGLESENTTVDYSPVRLAGLRDTLWLPSEVVVLVHFHNVFLRNTHRYSRFKLFEVHVVTNTPRRGKSPRRSSRGATCSGKCQ
jgi:hypothetical protein